MTKIINLLILLVFIVSTPLLARTKKPAAVRTLPGCETPSAYQKLTAEEFEWLLKTKAHLNPLQVVPVFNQDLFQFNLGPGHLQMTIPFR